jgi:hypothetical protein
LNENSFRELNVRGLLDVDAFPREGLDNAPWRQLTVVGVSIEITEGEAVELSIRETLDNVRLQVLFTLEI